MNPTLEKLKELLVKEGNDLARSCLEILTRSTLGLTSTEIPIKNARDIYSRRAKLNEDRRGPISGFEELIPRLLAENVERVGIHKIEAGEEWFFAFTDPNVTRLLGLLCIPGRKASENETK